MDILVKTRDQKEERVLLAFLAKRGYEFNTGDDVAEVPLNKTVETSVKEKEETEVLEQLDAEIEKGNYADQHKVEMLLNQRRNTVFK